MDPNTKSLIKLFAVIALGFVIVTAIAFGIAWLGQTYNF